MKKTLWVFMLLIICLNASDAKDRFNTISGSQQKLFYTDYGNNLVSIQPLIFDAQLGVGLGISYERYFSQKQKFEVVAPFALMFKNAFPKDNYKNRHGTNHSNFQKYIYFHPGVKIIASDPKSKATYGIGLSLLFAWTGTKLDSLTQFNENGQVDNYYQHVQKQALRLGLMVNNYLDIRMNQHLFLGMTVGVGFWVYDHETIISQIDKQVLLNEEYPAKATLKASVGLGYRF